MHTVISSSPLELKKGTGIITVLGLGPPAFNERGGGTSVLRLGPLEFKKWTGVISLS
jgi:hypothetical protein